MNTFNQDKINSLRQEVSTLRDASVSANTIKTQMETQIKSEVDQICSLIPQNIEEAYPNENIGLSESAKEVLSSAERVKEDITSAHIEEFNTSLNEFIAKVNAFNTSRLSEVEELISKWKAEINGGTTDAE